VRQTILDETGIFSLDASRTRVRRDPKREDEENGGESGGETKEGSEPGKRKEAGFPSEQTTLKPLKREKISCANNRIVAE